MNAFSKQYHPPTSSQWQGRDDGPRFHHVVQYLDLKNPSLKNYAGFGLIGFCCDEGVKRNQGRSGASEGPSAIRRVLANLPYPNQTKFYDAGDIVSKDLSLEDSQKSLAEAVAILIKKGLFPIVIGGGHELAWGHFQGVQKAYPQQNISIINFDAHLDLRSPLDQQKGTSGSSFFQIAQTCQIHHEPFDYTCIGFIPTANTTTLVEFAQKLNVKIISAEDLYSGSSETSLQDILENGGKIYLSICMDVFAAPFAPGVSAPQPLGMLPWQIIPLLQQIAHSGKVVSFDLAETNPGFDEDDRTAKLAASLINLLISFIQ